MLRVIILLLGLLTTPAFSQSSGVGGGPIDALPSDHNTEIDAIHRATVAQVRRLGLDRGLPRALPQPILEFPLRLRPNAKAPHSHAISNYVDLDTSTGIKEFACGSRSYDGHRGIDYFLWPYWWVMMDKQEVEIVAAAPGKIVSKRDGQFDRQCTANSQLANYVGVLQDDGVYAYYFHMKAASLTSKAIGLRVAAGEYLGLVGSSGSSTGPHLHLEFRAATEPGPGGTTVDPYAGRCGDNRTSWNHQHEYAHTAIVRVGIHKAAPNPGSSECGQNFAPNYADRFRPGDRVWIAAYIRDQRSNTPARFKVFRPNGTLALDITSGTPPTTYSAAYWYVWLDLPTSGFRGQWTARVTLDGQTVERPFILGSLPNPTKVASVVRPLTATASPTDPAKLRVVVRNTGSTEAIGCTVAPDVPLAAKINYVVRSTRAKDAAFNIPSGGREVLTLTIKPKRGYKAAGVTVPVRVFCINADAPPAKANTNIVTLTF